MSTCLIKNGILRIMEGEVPQYRRADLLIDGDRIAQIGQLSSAETDRTMNAAGKLVLPGFVNAHLHSHDNFNKAWLDNMPLETWMAAVRPFFSGVKHTPEMVYWRTIAGAAEMLRTGTTAVMDDVLLNGILDEECLAMIIKAYEDIGMRAVVSPHTKNIPMERTIPYADELFTDQIRQATCGPYPSEEQILSFFEDGLRTYNRPGRRVTMGLSTSAPQRSTLPLMQGVQALAKSHGVPVSCHVLETYVQKRTGELFYGKSLVEYLYDLGLLDENFVLIHCNWVTEGDMDLIKACRSKVVHNPVCNMKMGSGIAPVFSLRERGVTVGLGTDNVSANDGVNMFESMKQSALISKLRTPAYDRWLSSRDVICMATAGGADCLGQAGEIGALNPGMKADLTLVDTQNEQYALSADPDNFLVYSETGRHVDSVLVDGETVLLDGQLTRIEEGRLLSALAALRPAILREHELAARESQDVLPIFEKCYARCNEGRLEGMFRA